MKTESAKATSQSAAGAAPARYTGYHPRWYRERVSTWWWMKNRRSAQFILRELTSLGVVWTIAITLAYLYALVRGPQAYAALLARLQTPAFILVSGIALLLVLFHSISWFGLAPKAMPVRIGGKRVSDSLIAGSNYAAWIAVSAALAWLFIRSAR